MKTFQAFPSLKIPQCLIDHKFKDESWINDEGARSVKTLESGQVLIVWTCLENDTCAFSVATYSSAGNENDLAQFSNENNLAEFLKEYIGRDTYLNYFKELLGPHCDPEIELKSTEELKRAYEDSINE